MSSSRRRSAVGGHSSHHHGLGSVNEDPENGMNDGSDSETLSTVPKVKFFPKGNNKNMSFLLFPFVKSVIGYYHLLNFCKRTS